MNLAFLDSGPFMPHGHCYFWTESLIALHVISDALIVLAYYSIPITLVYFVRKRKDLEFNWMFVCFAVFILACGTTHVMEIWNIWHANYWLSGGVKGLTALASVPTAILLVKLIPQALALPSPSQLRQANETLQQEAAVRLRYEQTLQERTTALEKANQELNAALVELKELRGILPICCYCKNICNDKDYWQRVEEYITQRGGVMLTHSYCPQCYEKYVKPGLGLDTGAGDPQGN
jgi:hypothetical protein